MPGTKLGTLTFTPLLLAYLFKVTSPFSDSFIHPFKKYLLSTYYVASIVLGAEDTHEQNRQILVLLEIGGDI